jgi:hypothetical protein
MVPCLNKKIHKLSRQHGNFYQSTSCGLSRVIDEFSSGAAELHIYTYIQPEPDFSMHEPIPEAIHSNSR